MDDEVMVMYSLKHLQEYVSDLYDDGYDNYQSYNVRATVTDVQTDLSTIIYEGCPRDDCRKKVRPKSNGGYYCPKCRGSFQQFTHRYKLKVKLKDDSMEKWVIMFDSGTSFLGKTATELVSIHLTGTEQQYRSILYSRLNETFDFTISAANVKFRYEEYVNCIVEDFADFS